MLFLFFLITISFGEYDCVDDIYCTTCNAQTGQCTRCANKFILTENGECVFARNVGCETAQYDPELKQYFCLKPHFFVLNGDLRNRSGK